MFLTNVRVESNGADGIRYVFHDYPSFSKEDFCHAPNAGQNQVFPIRLTHKQSSIQSSTKECCQEFYANYWLGQRLTAHFPFLMSGEPDERERRDQRFKSRNGSIYVIDGFSGNKIADFVVSNFTRPQSVSSSGNGQLKICYRPAVYQNVLFTVEVVVDYGRAYDVNITDSKIQGNNGRGVWVLNQRSGTVINRTVISEHNYVSGAHVIGGTGDVIVNNSLITNNIGDGVNISLSGGFKCVDRSQIINNTLRGIAIWINESSYHFSSNFSSQISHSKISLNGDVGLIMSNVCRSDAFWNVTMNTFESNMGDAIRFLSCWHPNPKQVNHTDLLITHNIFQSNNRLAISIAPVFHLNATIDHNLFTLHKRGVIYINNRDTINEDFHYENVPADVQIKNNKFLQNSGIYVVNIGLDEESNVQKLLFTKNILKDNVITEAFPKLNPRSRVAAVAVVSSSNCLIIRNQFENPESRFELGSHLEIHSKTINASYNYWASKDTDPSRAGIIIHERIFDRKNRYNLAQIEFLQYITMPDALDSFIISNDQERDKLMPFPSDSTEIGGEVWGQIVLEPRKYTVRRDIYVRPEGELIIKEGAEFQFDQAIGMMVQGKLKANGGPLSAKSIRFTYLSQIDGPKNPMMLRTLNLINRGKRQAVIKYYENLNSTLFNSTGSNSSFIKKFEFNPSEKPTPKKLLPVQFTSKPPVTKPPVKVAQASTVQTFNNVRLSNGTEGRLEVFMNGRWGTVCNYGFDIEDAAVACQQMGLVLNSRDWLLEQSQFAVIGKENVILSHLECTHLDTDITKCKSQSIFNNDFENSCYLEVGIKCYPTAWAGIRIGILSDETTLENVMIDKAGLFDYSTHTFKPALQIDFNRFFIKNIIVQENRDAGLGIMWNDVLKNRENLNIIDSQIRDNMYHGIMTRSQGIRVTRNVLQNNKGGGFHYEPMFTLLEQKDLVSWIAPKDQSTIFTIPGNKIEQEFDIKPETGNSWYVIVKRKPRPDNFTHKLTLKTYVGRAIGVMVLSPVFEDSTESFVIKSLASDRDFRSNSNMNLKNLSDWNLRLNLTTFPLLYTGFKMVIEYKTGSNPIGGIVLYLATIDLQSRYPQPDIRLDQIYIKEQKEMTKMKLIQNQMINNYFGISSNHYNRDLSFKRDYYHRYSNETIFIKDNKIEASQMYSMLVSTPFYDPLQFTLSEINYTLIGNKFLRNNGGIVQYSRDIRNSNNLFHWTLNDSSIQDNLSGGFDVKLPYVWQYNENFTHSLSIHNNTIVRNNDFEFIIDGHFARFNMSQNIFTDNRCKLGLISINGMEKEMLIQDNRIEDNFVQFVVELNLQSHADKFGVVEANFIKNIIRNNRESSKKVVIDKYHPETYAMALRGVQEVNITRNIFENRNLQFEFLAGVLTGSLDGTINVEQNWWGTTNPAEIKKRIFDFDDWNSFSVAVVTPFLVRNNIYAEITTSDMQDRTINIDEPFGGRLFGNLVLSKRNRPYVINSDFTVMPEATLTINAGVEIEFFPSVGMLVLGEMMAGGLEDQPIIMRSVKYDNSLRFKRQHKVKREVLALTSPYSSQIGDVRLCITEGCDETRLFKRRDGFVEIFNLTTLQWAPICDKKFTERNAQVVCRQLGYSTLNVHIQRGRRYDMGQTLISRIRHWPEPLECIGKETSLSECDIRLNGYGNHSYSCAFDGEEFVYVYCGKDNKENDEQEHWGGIRFALKGFERKNEGNIYIPTRSYYIPSSRLQFVQIYKAGILHGEKNAAIQMIQREVSLDHVKVESSAYHAVEVISPNGHLTFHRLDLHNNLGAGLNYVLLSGSSTESPLIPYKPLGVSGIPYSAFGLVDICDRNKELVIDERIFLYYKYDNRPVDCVKIFSSVHTMKKIGFRLLQFNLFNSTDYLAQPDSLKIFDGDIFNQTSILIGDLNMKYSKDNSPELKLYSSSESYALSLSVQLHATGASGDYGFIAEVATLPVSYYLNRGVFHNLTYSNLSHNTLGAIQYRSAGESTPAVSFHHNIIEKNCEELYGNFTTCNGSIYMEMQNSQFLYFQNNLVRRNQGALHVLANSHSSVSSVTGIIYNNLFEANKNNEVIFFQGAQSGHSYQTVDIQKNYFTRNYSPYKSNIYLYQVIANFSQNIVVSNVGQAQMSIIGFEQVPLSYQTCRKSWFYNNFATKLHERSTIIASTAGQTYVDNYFVNPDNDFEIATLNRTNIYPNQNLEDLRIPSIKAGNNWWGFNETSAVEARIRDFKDYFHLIPVDYNPIYTSNLSVLSGICSGGWEKIGETCFVYIGARMNYDEARDFCGFENSSMPFIRVNQEEVTRFIYTQQENFDRRFHMVWVQSFEIGVDDCGVLINGQVRRHDCNDQLPFLCEKNPDVRVLIPFWYREPMAIAALTISCITALLTLICISCWLCKSKHRQKEKLERRNSIRASIRSNRSYSSSVNTLRSLDDTNYRRQIERVLQQARIQRAESQASSTYEKTLTGSVSSVEKHPSQFDDESSVQSYQTSQRGGDNYSDITDRFAHDPRLENANINMLVHPTFDLTFENRGFRATPSLSRTPDRIREWSPGTSSTLDVTKKSIPTLTPHYAEYQIGQNKGYNDVSSESSRASTPRQPIAQPLRYSRELPPIPHQRPNFSTFNKYPSQSSVNGASSLASGMNVPVTPQRRYLETSLDDDSCVESDVYDDYQLNRLSPVSSATTVESNLTTRSKPLETAM